jgi:hypothetical protein
MMRNEDVVKGFRDGINCHTENLSSENGKLYSYATCIAQWHEGKIYLNYTKYSTTTSHHQTLVRRHCNPYKIGCDTIPRNIVNLEKYINGQN